MLSGSFGYFKSEFRKKGKGQFFRLRRAVGFKESQKKRRKKNFVRDVFLCGSSISGDKWAEKVSGFVFLRNWRGKM